MSAEFEKILYDLKKLQKKVQDSSSIEELSGFWIESGKVAEILEDAFKRAFKKINLVWDYDSLEDTMKTYIKEVHKISIKKDLENYYNKGFSFLSAIRTIYGQRNLYAHPNRTKEYVHEHSILIGKLSELIKSLKYIKEEETELFGLLCQTILENPRSPYSKEMSKVFYGEVYFAVKECTMQEKSPLPIELYKKFLRDFYNLCCNVAQKNRLGLCIPKDLAGESIEKQLEVFFNHFAESEKSMNIEKLKTTLNEIDEQIIDKFNNIISHIPNTNNKSRGKLKDIFKKRQTWRTFHPNQGSQSNLSEIEYPYTIKLYVGIDPEDNQTLQIKSFVLYSYCVEEKNWKAIESSSFEERKDVREYCKNIYKKCSIDPRAKNNTLLLLAFDPTSHTEEDTDNPLEPLLRDWQTYKYGRKRKLYQGFSVVGTTLNNDTYYAEDYFECDERTVKIKEQVQKNDFMVIEQIPHDIDSAREEIYNHFNDEDREREVLICPKGDWLSECYIYNIPILLAEEELSSKLIQLKRDFTFPELLKEIQKHVKNEKSALSCIFSNVQWSEEFEFSNQVSSM